MRLILLVFVAAACRGPDLQDPGLTPEIMQQGYVLGSQMGDDPMIFVLDENGDMLWELPSDEEMLSPAVEPSLDGQAVLYNEFSSNREEDVGVVYRLDLDGSPAEVTRTEWAHHTFTEHADGTLAYVAVDIRETEDYGAVVGDRIIELYPDGSAKQIFSTWEELTIEQHENWESGFYPQGHDWTHANALHFDAERNTYLMSFRNINSIMEIDRDTGHVIRAIGGELSNFEIEGTSPEFLYPHGVRWSDSEANTILFTASNEVDGSWVSWAMELQLDDETGVATEIWNYGQDEGIYAYALGEARRLHNGNTLINWGGAGVLREVTPAGVVVWEYEADIGNFYGHTSYLPDHF